MKPKQWGFFFWVWHLTTCTLLSFHNDSYGCYELKALQLKKKKKKHAKTQMSQMQKNNLAPSPKNTKYGEFVWFLIMSVSYDSNHSHVYHFLGRLCYAVSFCRACVDNHLKTTSEFVSCLCLCMCFLRLQCIEPPGPAWISAAQIFKREND